MADYGQPNGRDYSRNQTNGSRDAAFAHIFGGAPPPGRSQTMSSQPVPTAPDRSQTMPLQPADRMRQSPPPIRQHQNGYPLPAANHYSRPQPYGAPMRAPLPNQRMPPPQQLPPQQHQQHLPPQQYQQHLPPQQLPQQRQYGDYSARGEPRMDPRLEHRAQNMPQAPYQNPSAINRYPNAHPMAPADNYHRSQSLAASSSRPQVHAGQGGNYSISPAQTFRQQQYNPMNRTTAQGRVVPERPDERTMSMSSHAREHERSQTMSGRVIPTRRRESHETATDRSSQGSAPPGSPHSPVTTRSRTISQSSQGPRSLSMASTVVAPSEQATTDGLSKSDSHSNQKVVVAQRRSPLVYPALLSRVAEIFKDRINLSDHTKDGLDYTSAFTGEDAVTLIAYIIKTTDRNLALLLGRSLDAQKFFHDVTYGHRLRDLRSEVYQFREQLVEDENEVNGVFTLLTECYSPTCTRDRLCYSIACPRRLEQQARLKLKPQPGLKRADSHTSLHDEAGDDQKLWINTVSKEVSDSVGDREKKRQEVISELMYTERDFVKDLEYMRDFWMKPLRNPMTSPIPEAKRDKFIKAVFSNISEVYGVNGKLAEALTRRQQENPVVYNVGSIFLEHVPRFAPFITYGASQLFGKFEFENEKRSNLHFAKFVDETERLKESRKLELNGYLTKPTTRLARYPLLLEGIAKYTADDNPDKKDLPKAIALIKEFLSKVNTESGKAENLFNLMQLSKDLKFRPGEYVDLKLTEENRQLLFKGMLKKNPADQQGDIQAYLFDHAVLLVRIKQVNKKEELKVYRKPIPLELLVIAEMNEIMPKSGITKRPSSGLMASRTTTMSSTMSTKDSTKPPTYPITFRHLGKGGFELTLYCATPIQQTKWMEHIDAQQRTLRERSDIFTRLILNEGFFTASIRVNCCVPIDGGRKLVLGTEAGVYVVDRKPKDSSTKPRRVLDCRSVTQIDVLEQHQILLVLTDKTMYSYPIEALNPDDSQAAVGKRGRKICHANFFKAGVCQGNQLVCCVKTSALSTTIKVYEPMDSMTKKSKKSGLAKILANSQDVLKPLKEFYIPTESTSIHFLRSKLCVGCARGFEVVSLETLEAQSLLDQADTSLDFVQRKENIKPIHIERIATEFLLCYTDYSFFVNRNGWRARPNWMITWEGNPQAFAIFNPYILAFEPSFIEIRHMETGMLVHIVTAKNVRMLHSSSREILYAYEDEMGEDVIASLDFWGTPGAAVRPQEHNTPARPVDQRQLEYAR